MPVTGKTCLFLICPLIAVLALGCSRDSEVAKREYVASGDDFLSQNKIKEAIVQYRNAVRQDPRFGEARFKLAEAYVQNHDLTAAAREYIRAADLLPNNADAQVKAGRFLLLSRRFEDAKTRADQALTLDARNSEAQILLGNALAGLRDLDGAIEELQEAIKLDPNGTRGYVNLGAVEKAAGRHAQAEVAFRKAIEVDPTSVAAHLALANFYWAAGKPAETVEALHLAFKLEPNHPLVNQMLALYLITVGKAGEAEPYFRKLAELSNDRTAKLALADYYIASGRSKDAVPLLQQLTSNKLARSGAELRLADLAFREGRREEAHRRLDELLTREPSNAAGLVLRGRALVAEGKVDAALTPLTAAVSADSSSAEAQFALGQAYLAQDDRERAIQAFNETLRLNPRAVRAHVELSRLELAGGHVDNSIQLAEQAVKNEANSPEARLALVRGLIARRDLRRADDELRVLTTQHPGSSAVKTQHGILAAAKGDKTTAVKFLAEALSLDGDNLEALNALIALHLSQTQVAQAIALADSQLARRPDNADVLLLAGRTFAAAGDLDKSELVLRKAIEVDASNVQAYSMLGRVYLRQNRLGEALAEFDALSKRQPRPVQAHTMVASLLEAQNKPQEARARYEQALAIDPEMPVAANNLAWMYAETGQNLDVALDLAQTAARRLPDHPAVQDTLGWIYYKKGLSNLAVPAFQKSIAGDPRNPTYHFHLGLAYAQAGDPVKARSALQQAVQLEPGFQGAAEARHVLASLVSR